MKDGLTIYFIRHGETDWNAERRYQGQTDIPLNDNGRAQARRNGEVLRTLLPGIAEAHFVSSPLERTRETMQIVRATLGLAPEQFEVDRRIIELNYGHWEGQLASDLVHTDPEGIAARAADPYLWRPRGGENYVDISRRLADWLTTLNRDTVAVSHGGVSRALRSILTDDVGRADILDLDVPQDRILVLKGRQSSWI